MKMVCICVYVHARSSRYQPSCTLLTRGHPPPGIGAPVHPTPPSPPHSSPPPPMQPRPAHLDRVAAKRLHRHAALHQRVQHAGLAALRGEGQAHHARLHQRHGALVGAHQAELVDPHLLVRRVRGRRRHDHAARRDGRGHLHLAQGPQRQAGQERLWQGGDIRYSVRRHLRYDARAHERVYTHNVTQRWHEACALQPSCAWHL